MTGSHCPALAHAVYLCLAPLVWSQTPSAVEGRVTDTAGAVLAGTKGATPLIVPLLISYGGIEAGYSEASDNARKGIDAARKFTTKCSTLHRQSLHPTDRGTPMTEERYVLADRANFGSIYQCAEGCFHLQVGPVNIRLTRETYFDLVELVHTSAANYEARNNACGADWSNYQS